MRVPLVILAPYRMPDEIAPSQAPSFKRRFSRAMPHLYSRLLNAASADSTNTVSWEHIMHWMWPLLDVERWGAWRIAKGLHPCPLSGQTTLPAPPLLLYGISSIWGLEFFNLKSIPSNVHVTGHWFSDAIMVLPDDVRDFVLGCRADTTSRGTVLIDFGSMPRLGHDAISQPVNLLVTLRRACKLANVCALILGGCSSLMIDAWVSMSGTPIPKGSESHFYQHTLSPTFGFYSGPLPHTSILPHVDCIMHHGGSGTTAAALRLGVPQLVVPFMFDQFQWASRVASLGLGVEISTDDVMDPLRPVSTAFNLSRSITLALDSGVKSRAIELAESIALEDGVTAAVDLSLKYIRAWGSPRPSDIDAGDEMVIVLPNAMPLRCTAPADALHVYQEIFDHQCYTFPRLAGMGDPAASWLKPGSVVFDVGAHIGLFTLWALGHVKLSDSVTICAFEPLTQSYNTLRRNIALHSISAVASSPGEMATVVEARTIDIGPLVYLSQVGLHASSGLVEVTYYPSMPSNSTACPDDKLAQLALFNKKLRPCLFDGATTALTRMSTVSGAIDHFAVACLDLLKVDVEGCELEVLQGVQEHHWPRIRRVVVEVNEVRSTKRLNHVLTILHDQGFEVQKEVTAGSLESDCYNYMVYAWRDE